MCNPVALQRVRLLRSMEQRNVDANIIACTSAISATWLPVMWVESPRGTERSKRETWQDLEGSGCVSGLRVSVRVSVLCVSVCDVVSGEVECVVCCVPGWWNGILREPLCCALMQR